MPAAAAGWLAGWFKFRPRAQRRAGRRGPRLASGAKASLTAQLVLFTLAKFSLNMLSLEMQIVVIIHRAAAQLNL